MNTKTTTTEEVEYRKQAKQEEELKKVGTGPIRKKVAV